MKSELEREFEELIFKNRRIINLFGRVAVACNAVKSLALSPYYVPCLISYARAGKSKGRFQSSLLQIE